MEPPNKGHIGDNINSAVLSFIERLSSFRGSKCTKTIGHVIFGTSNSVFCREVYYTVSLFWRVHYRRFHCTHTCSLSPLSESLSNIHVHTLCLHTPLTLATSVSYKAVQGRQVLGRTELKLAQSEPCLW